MRPHLFLTYLIVLLSITCFSAAKNVRFSVNLGSLINQNKFNPSADKVYVRGTFNNWDKSNELLVTVDNVYSTTVGLPENSYSEYKYYITSPGAENNGWENSFPVTEDGNRMI